MNNFKLNKNYLLLLLISVIFFSCDNEQLEGDFAINDNDENVFNPNENATFEVELNGELFVAESVEAFFTEDGYTIDAKNGNKKVSISLPTLSVNTYEFSNEGNDAFISFTDNQNFANAFFSGSNGSLTVTSLNQETRTAGGNFDGTLTEILANEEDISMTNGQFQNVVFIPGFDDFDFNQVGGDFMTALFDGEAFDADQISVFTDIDLAEENEEEEEGDEDGNEDEDVPEPEPEFIFVRGTQTIDVDLPDIDLPDGEDGDIDIPDSITIGITLRFPVNQPVGVFEFDQNSAIQASLDTEEFLDEASGGVIDVQSFNETEIRGQFNFTTSSGEVTGGAFRATP